MKRFWVFCALAFTIASCGTKPCHTTLTHSQLTTIRNDFNENCYKYLTKNDMSEDSKLFLIRAWWDLQEMKSIIHEGTKP